MENMVAKQCELIDICGFFNNFQGSTEAIKEGWIQAFCMDLDKSSKCERKKIYQTTGETPEDNMTPTGVLID